MAYTENEIFNLVNGSEVTGQSPYDLWKSLGNEGTAEDFLNYLKDDGESNVSEETLAQIEKNKNDISQLSEEIADKAILENGVIKFYKSGETDKELFAVDISSIGGTGGLDLNNLTLSVSQVGNYQRLSMSDGTTTKTVDIPITVVTSDQIQEAVNAYLAENPPSEFENVVAQKSAFKTIVLSDVAYYSGKVATDGSITTGSNRYSDYIDIIGSKEIKFQLPTSSAAWLSLTINCIFYNSEKVEVIRRAYKPNENGIITISNIGDNVRYLIINDLTSWAFSSSAYLRLYNTTHNLLLNEDVKIKKESIVKEYEYKNLFDKDNMLTNYSGFKIGDNLETYRNEPASSFYYVFIPVKHGTTYTIVETSGNLNSITDTCVLDYFENVIYVGNKNASTLPLTSDTVTTYKGGKYCVFTVNELLPENARYLGIRFNKTVDLSSLIIYEGLPENYNGYVPYEDGNGFKFDDDLLIQEKNLSVALQNKLKKSDTSLQPADLESEEYAFATHSKNQILSFPMINTFSIGEIQKLFNSARILQADANHLGVGNYYSHCPSVVVIGEKAYIVAFENKTNSTDKLEYTTIELYVLDLENWAITEQINIATKGLSCGSDTLKYGGIDPNVLNINNETLRITFTTQLSDGIHCICYRDYNVSTKSLGEVGLCNISDGTNVYRMNVDGVKSVCGEFKTSVTNPALHMTSQYSKYNGEYYIGLGVDEYYSNIPILKTSDFITFTLWAVPTIDGNNAHYECACIVAKMSNGTSYLYTATRQVRDENKREMLIMQVSLTDASIISHTWIPDGHVRPHFYYDGNISLYLFHTLDVDRYTSTITKLTTNTLNSQNVHSIADMFAMTYAFVLDYGEEWLVAYMRSFKMYVAKIPKLPIYTHEKVIPIINKFLDLFVAE